MTHSNLTNTFPYQGELKISLPLVIIIYCFAALFSVRTGNPAAWVLPLTLASLFAFTAWRIWYTRIKLGWPLTKLNAGAAVFFVLFAVVIGYFSSAVGFSDVRLNIMSFSLVMVPVSWFLKKPSGAVSDKVLEIVDFCVIGFLYALFGVWGTVDSWNQTSSIVFSMPALFAVAGAVLIFCSPAIVRVGSEKKPFMESASWCAFAKPVLLVALVPFSFFLLPSLNGEGSAILSNPNYVSLVTAATMLMASTVWAPFIFEFIKQERKLTGETNQHV